VTEGSRIRLAGQGGVHPGGRERRDLFLRVHIAPHPLFKLDKYDLRVGLMCQSHRGKRRWVRR
jgi:DnaJ-class molecular chaperone